MDESKPSSSVQNKRLVQEGK